MNDQIRERLRASDPLASEVPPAPADVERMRRTIVAAARDRSGVFASWQWRVPIATALAIFVLVLVSSLEPWFASRSPDISPVNDPTPRPVARTTPPRQLQFVTAGGTRIIWILNDELDEWSQR